MNAHDTSAKAPTGFLRRIRWWIPAGLVVLAVANFFRIRLSTELDSNFKAMQISLTIGVLPLLLLRNHLGADGDAGQVFELLVIFGQDVATRALDE